MAKDLQALLATIPRSVQLVLSSYQEETVEEDGTKAVRSWNESLTLERSDDIHVIQRILDQALIDSPDDPWLRCLRGEWLAARHYYQCAMEDVKHALKVQPTHAPSMQLLGELCFIQERYPSAFIVLSCFLTYAPQDMQAYAVRGLTCFFLAEETCGIKRTIFQLLALHDLQKAYTSSTKFHWLKTYLHDLNQDRL